jgi:hypothetical protein
VLGELYDSEGDIDSFNAREANAKINNINSRLISKACGWLITRLRQAKSSKKTYQNVSMLMQLDNAYMLSLINQNNQEVKINNKLLSSSTSIRMLLDLAGTAISSNNLFFFDDYKNDFYKLFKLLDPDYLISKKAKQDNSIKDLDGLKQLIRNCFSTARVLIDESVKKLQLRLHQSDLIRLKVIPHSIAGSGDQPKSPLYKEICYLELYKPAFDRIYQGDSLAQLASKRLSLVSQRIARLNDKKELDLSKMEDLLELTRQSTLDSVGQAVSELDKIGIRLDSMLDMFERIDLEYCKMYQELGRLAFGNDGLSYIITILSLRDALRKVPVLGSFMSKDSPTLEQFIAELDATRPRLNQASLSTNEGISKNLDALGLALNVATQNPKKRDLIRILTDSSSQKTSIYSKLGRVISRINRLDEISVQEGFRSNKQLNGTLGSAGQIAAATISRGAVGLSLSLGALLVLSASGIFIVCLFLFTKELRAFLASGLNFGVMGQILQQEKAYERTQELISQIAATSDQESKKQLTDLLNVVHSSFKESSNLVLEGLEIQMRKPSIFDAPGILAVNAAYVAVGLFAVWGTARIYFMAKEKQGKLDSK